MSIGIVALARRLFRSPATPKTCPAPSRRVRLGGDAFALEDRAVPAANPTNFPAAPNGGQWVLVGTATVDLKNTDNGTNANGTKRAATFTNPATGGAYTPAANATLLAVAYGQGQIDGNATTGKADAERLRYTATSDGQDGASQGYGDTNHGIRFNGLGTTTAANANFWGTAIQRADDHQYSTVATADGSATTPLTAFYRDVPGKYGDNSGTITVEVYEQQSVITITGTQTASEYDDALPTPGPKNGSITFQRTGDTNKAETVTFSVGGTATYGTANDFTLTGNGVIYNPTTGEATVRFEQGEQYATVTVVPVGDNNPEGEEVVEFELVPGNGYVPGEADPVPVTVADTAGVASSTLDFDGLNFASAGKSYTFTLKVATNDGQSQSVDIFVDYQNSTANTVRDSVESALKDLNITVEPKNNNQLIIKGSATASLLFIRFTRPKDTSAPPTVVAKSKLPTSDDFPTFYESTTNP